MNMEATKVMAAERGLVENLLALRNTQERVQGSASRSCMRVSRQAGQASTVPQNRKNGKDQKASGYARA